MSLYLNMANAPVKIWGKFSQYALQILDFTLNMPHEILGPVAPPHPKRSGVPPPGLAGVDVHAFLYLAVVHGPDTDVLHPSPPPPPPPPPPPS